MIEKDRVCGIYCIENIETGKRYVGSSVTIPRRWRIHKLGLSRNNHLNKYLQASWNKYGKESFIFYVLEYCKEDELNFWEVYWIRELDTFGEAGYNLTRGGGGAVGFKLSEETKRKISESHKGENSAWFGRHHTEEEKRKIADAIKGPKHYRYGKKYSKEELKLLSDIKLGEKNTFFGKHHTEESKKKISKAKFGKKHGSPSDEVREKMSKAKKLWWDTKKGIISND